nr:bacteriocin-protection protein [Sporichthyaceae bacterium]
MAVADAPTIAFRDQPAFRTWLAEHHREQDGIWLKLAKKGSGIPSVTYAEAVVVALCFGWIDGQARSVDETSYVQRFTPRRSRSKWSKINIGRVEAL